MTGDQRRALHRLVDEAVRRRAIIDRPPTRGPRGKDDDDEPGAGAAPTYATRLVVPGVDAHAPLRRLVELNTGRAMRWEWHWTTRTNEWGNR